MPSAKGFKEKLPTKICVVRGRSFQYRKKWKNVWGEVKFCSQKCRKQSKSMKT